MLIGLDTLRHLADEAGYALTPEGRWVEIERVKATAPRLGGKHS